MQRYIIFCFTENSLLDYGLLYHQKFHRFNDWNLKEIIHLHSKSKV